MTPCLFFFMHARSFPEQTLELLILLEFVLRRQRENKLASDHICSRFCLTYDWPGSPWFVCGDTEELPELLKGFEATGHHQLCGLLISA